MTKELLTIDMLRKILRYEPATGKLFWLERDLNMFKENGRSKQHSCNQWNSRFANKEASCAKKPGDYYAVQIFRKKMAAHRVAWALYYGKWPKDQIDHINRNKQDNRICNLREVSNAINSKNRNLSSKNTSGCPGVQRDKKTWRAVIGLNGKQIHLGNFAKIEDAIQARKAAEIKLGYFQNS